MINYLLNICFKVFRRAFPAVFKADERMKIFAAELLKGREETTVRLTLIGTKRDAAFVIERNDVKADYDNNCDSELAINFKNAHAALRVFLGRESIVSAYVSKHFYVTGNLNELMIYLEMTEILFAYLLPKRTALKLLGYNPIISGSRRQVFRQIAFGR